MRNLKRSTFALSILIALLCAGCDRQLTEGEVIAKRYEPESTFVMMMPMVMSCGNGCTTTMMIPYVVFDDEDYVITVRGINEDGDEITEDWYVSKVVYEQTKAGGYEVFDDLHASRNDEHEKLKKANT